MFLLDNLLMMPARGIMAVFREVYNAAQQEGANEAESIRTELSELYMLLETQQLSEADFERREKELLDRLDELERHGPEEQADESDLSDESDESDELDEFDESDESDESDDGDWEIDDSEEFDEDDYDDEESELEAVEFLFDETGDEHPEGSLAGTRASAEDLGRG